MFKRKRLLVSLVLLLLACRLPFVVGQRLASRGEATPSALAQSATTPATRTPTAGSVYPGAAGPGTGITPYPGLGGGQPTLPPATPGDAYPGSGPVQATTLVIPTGTAPADGAYPGLPPGPGGSGLATATSGVANVPGAPTQPALPQPDTPAAAGASTVVIPSATPFLTPTPTITPTPTLTRTPLPLPPWSRAPLEATDPRTVKLASGQVQLIEFFAYWSGPSQAMAPIMQGIEDEYGDQVNFVYLDIDNPASETFADELGFDRAPQFFLLAPDGRIVEEWTGYVAVADLRAAIEAALNP